jgi:uncharacterized protein YjbI with pentapeptide repeats
MKVVVEPGLVVGWQVCRFERQRLSASFIAKLACKLGHDVAAVRQEEPELLSGDRHWEDDLTKGLFYSSDFAPLKPRADVLVQATAHAPAELPVRLLNVTVQVGSMSKRLTVCGKRTWRKGMIGRSGFTEPELITNVPITYENAFGGPGSKKNPLGRGLESEELPLIEHRDRMLKSPRDDLEPAVFGPIAPSWQPRASLVGSYGKEWLKERWPWFPDDFDYGYFNAAPRDQQIEGYLKGDENLLFENLHPVHTTYTSRLPGLRLRCFLQEEAGQGQFDFREVRLVLDTLWIDLNVEKMVLVWRGHVSVRTLKLKEVQQVLAWTEPLSAPVRPASYCPIFLAERKRAEEAEFEEEPGSSEEPDTADADFENAFAEFDRDIEQAEEEIAEAQATAKKQMAEERARMIASGIDPALLEPNPAAMSPLDALREAIRRGGSPEERAALERSMTEYAEAEAEAEALEKELDADFPPDPTREDLLTAAANGASLAESDLSEMDLSLQNLAGVDFRGASLRKCNLKGTNLQKANFTGASLEEADLTGADLTAAILDDADLTEAKLSGAKLRGMSLKGTIFSGLSLPGMDFSKCTGKRPDFSGCDLTGARFVAAVLPQADFSECKLERADFNGSEIPKAQLDGARAAEINLADADIRGMSASDGADLSRASFQGAKATGAIFEQAILDRANFSRAILTRAQFTEASLRATNLDRVDAASASFEDASLKHAILTRANLLRATFDRADLTDANFEGANLYEAGFWETVRERTNLRGANLKGTVLG